jgi:hypothetical protein
MYRGTEHNREINYSVKAGETQGGRNAHNNMSIEFNLTITL